MKYRFAVFSPVPGSMGPISTGLMFTGEVEAPTLDQATIKAAHEGARLAYGMQLEWDPFNLRIAVKPKRKPKQRATHK